MDAGATGRIPRCENDGVDETILTVGADADGVLRSRIQDLLRSFNDVRGVPLPDATPLTVTATAPDGSFLGGCVGATYWSWLVVDVLAVEERVRGRGIGRQLVDVAEQEARRRGCTRAHTTAYEFQGLGFWIERGYGVAGELPDYPPGHTSHWLHRDL